MTADPQPSTHRSAGALVVIRRVANIANLSTVAGWAMARARGTRLVPGPHGLLIGYGYPRVFPLSRNSAITIGDVVLVRADQAATAAKRPRLLDHEARHAAQWACLIGPFGFVPLYGLASLWSLLRTGHPAWANVFEVMANLDDGGYVPGARARGRIGPRR